MVLFGTLCLWQRASLNLIWGYVQLDFLFGTGLTEAVLAMHRHREKKTPRPARRTWTTSASGEAENQKHPRVGGEEESNAAHGRSLRGDTQASSPQQSICCFPFCTKGERREGQRMKQETIGEEV